MVKITFGIVYIMLIVVPIFAFKSLHFKFKFPFKIALKMGCHGCNFYNAFFGSFGTDFEAILESNLAPKITPKMHPGWSWGTGNLKKHAQEPKDPQKAPKIEPRLIPGHPKSAFSASIWYPKSLPNSIQPAFGARGVPEACPGPEESQIQPKWIQN